jgi:cytochrome c-type biogenesis protein CcmH
MTSLRRPRPRFLAALALLPMLVFASAIEPYPFDSELQRKRFQDLAEELRCTVCQNQSLADSEAPLARDLREQLFRLLEEGRSDQEIRMFMVERYGEFVLYNPPLAAHTALLWGGPVLLLIGGLVAAFVVIARRRRAL